MTIFNLATLPGYYYLYALYHDYPANNDWNRPREYAEQVRQALRYIQPMLAARQPVRKSMALRLFTEREALHRFSPEQVSEAWRQLREVVDLLGPPPQWPHPPRSWSQHASTWVAKQDAWADHLAERRARDEREPPSQDRTRRFPKSPVDYKQQA